MQLNFFPTPRQKEISEWCIVYTPDIITHCSAVAESAGTSRRGVLVVGRDDVYRSCHTSCHVRMKRRERILSGGTVQWERRDGETAEQKKKKNPSSSFSLRSSALSLLPPPPNIHPGRHLPLSPGAIIVNHLLSEAGAKGQMKVQALSSADTEPSADQSGCSLMIQHHAALIL